jgi:hypothetical protein
MGRFHACLSQSGDTTLTCSQQKRTRYVQTSITNAASAATAATALQPATVKEIQTVLFFCKMPRYIRDFINPWEFQDPDTLTQR